METSGASIEATTLAGSSNGKVDFGKSTTNEIANLGDFTTSGGNFTLTDDAALTVNGTVDTDLTPGTIATGTAGEVTLNDSSTIAESSTGAIYANALTGSSVGGTTLNGSNVIGILGMFTNTVSGGFALTDGETLAVDGPLIAGGNIALTTTSGGIAINTPLNAPTVTLSSTGSVTQTEAIAANLELLGAGGSYTLTNPSNDVSTLAANTGTVNLNDGSTTLSIGTVGSTSGVTATTLTLTDTGAVTQTEAIAANLELLGAGGSYTLTNPSNDVSTLAANTGTINLTDHTALTIGTVGSTNGVTTAGNLTLTTTGTNSNLSIDAGLTGATNAANQVAMVELNTTGTGNATLYDAESLTVSSSFVNGNLTMLTTGNLVFVSSVQSPTGAILAVAGWDGTTTDPSALTAAGAYGNNGGSIVIGGSGASGNVAVGTIGGSTTLAGDNVSLEAINGYAQIGYDGAASGNIAIVANGNVTLTGGAQTGQFAQIGNGGYETSGNESGNISIDAAGSLTLNGGTGQEAYSQIGQGGAESNAASSGYSETGTISIDAEAVALVAGVGNGSYAQIGEGGYETGKSLDGAAVLSGTITVDATTAVTLTGNGDAAYAQIGSGGDLVNSGAADGSSGVLSGDVVVDVSAPASRNAVTLTAGTGAAAYTQIGNGGNDENAPASGATVSFDVTGDISVSDLALTGSTTGADAYAQVGNGDASNLGTGNIDGTITIWPAEDVTLTYGTATGADVLIGNATEFGTASETLVGYVPMTDQTTSVIATTIQPGSGTKPGAGTTEGQRGSDVSTQPLGSQAVRSALASQTIIPTLLTQIVVVGNTRSPHGVPPADEDYSSWGNEALWR